MFLSYSLYEWVVSFMSKPFFCMWAYFPHYLLNYNSVLWLIVTAIKSSVILVFSMKYIACSGFYAYIEVHNFLRFLKFSGKSNEYNNGYRIIRSSFNLTRKLVLSYFLQCLTGIWFFLFHFVSCLGWWLSVCIQKLTFDISLYVVTFITRIISPNYSVILPF